MNIVVLADDDNKMEFENKKLTVTANITYADNFSEILNEDADVFFILKDEINTVDHKLFKAKPVFLNSTINTLSELDLPENFHRFNGWPTFLNRDTWDIATGNEEALQDIFKRLEWKYIKVADEPGLVSSRIVSMIINEAYFTLGDEVSTKNEIDIAMKLGTNYPYGPFEWCKKIGLPRVHNLLKKLSETDNKYAIAPAMEYELTAKK